MAFNGDGPHSKRQRLEESGHRVSTRLLHDRGPRVVPRSPPPPRTPSGSLYVPLFRADPLAATRRPRRGTRASFHEGEARRHLSA